MKQAAGFLALALVISQVTTPKPWMHGVPIAVIVPLLFAVGFAVAAWRGRKR